MGKLKSFMAVMACMALLLSSFSVKAAFVVPDPGACMGHWLLNDDPSDGVLDSSGSNHPSSVESAGGVALDNTKGVNDGSGMTASYAFNGAGRINLIPNAPIPKDFSMSMWVRTTSTGTTQNLMGMNGKTKGWLYRKIDKRFVIANLSTAVTSETFIEENKWYFIGFSHDASNRYTIYLQAEDAPQPEVITGNGAMKQHIFTDLLLGTKHESTPGWIGNVDDIRMYTGLAFNRATFASLYHTTHPNAEPISDEHPPTWPQDASISTQIVDAASVRLSWPSAIDDIGILQYNIYKRLAHEPVSANKLAAIAGGSEVSAIVTALAADTEYIFAVEAVDKGLNAAIGPSVTFKTPKIVEKYTPVEVNTVLKSGTRKLMSLDGIYKFKDDPGDVGSGRQWYLDSFDFGTDTIAVPGNMMTAGYRDNMANAASVKSAKDRFAALEKNPYSPAWYKRNFEVPQDFDTTKPIFIKFGGVMPACEVWVNGNYLGYHEGATVPFAYKVDDLLTDGTNTLVVKIIDDITARIMAGGYSRMNFFSGIFRSVELEQTEDVRTLRFLMEPDIDRDSVIVHVWVKNHSDVPKSIGIKSDIFDAKGLPFAAGQLEGQTVSANGEEKFTFSVPMQNARLWSTDDPYLYSANIQILESDTLKDSLKSHFGMRKLHVADGKIYVNNKPFYLRGAGYLCVNAHTLSPNVDREQIKAELQQIKDYGYNHLRLHSTTPPPEFLEAADEVGIFLQTEAAVQGTYTRIKQYAQTQKAYIWTNLVMRDLNNPSLMIRCMGNEGHYNRAGNVTEDGITQNLMDWGYAKAKEIDPTRFVLATAHFESAKSINASDVIETNKDYPDSNGKPYYRHEFGHFSAYPDITLEAKYLNSALYPWQIQRTKQSAEENGLTELLPTFREKSLASQKDSTKYGFEWFRREKLDGDGYSHWLAQDNVQLQMGVFDDFFDPKTNGFTAREMQQFNGDTVVLPKSTIYERVFESGGTFTEALLIHHTNQEALQDGTLNWMFKNIETGAVLDTGTFDKLSVAGNGRLDAGIVTVMLPVEVNPARYELSVSLVYDGKTVTNQWIYWVYPVQTVSADQATHRIIVDMDNSVLKDQILSHYPFAVTGTTPQAADILITDKKTAAVNHVDSGGKVLVMAGNISQPASQKPIFPSQTNDWGDRSKRVPEKWVTYFTISGYYYGNFWGSVIDKTHPITKNLASDGYIDWGLAHLYHDEKIGSKNYCYAVRIDDPQWSSYRINPLIRAIDYYGENDPLAFMFEASKSNGVMLVSGLYYDLDRHMNGLYMFDQSLRYLLSSDMAKQ
ncbi:MAG: beta galactosidase jelly roll domain-containing protein [Firmicutes bacterium]|nr:beta galactosidase jelly roll domain-containing protein [Bacillota bacterium]